jgi:Fe-Mn family superoxide dismutase
MWVWMVLTVLLSIWISLVHAEEQEGGPGLILTGLPYSFEALEPAIDLQTMKLHWGRHHKAYTDNANIALRGLLTADSVSDDLKKAAKGALANNEERLQEAIELAIKEEPGAPPPTKKLLRSLRNNGGGFSNHNDYWQNLAPPNAGGGSEPSGDLAAALIKRFGSVDAFRETFVAEGLGIFGSGWVWLVVTPQASLEITTTPNQDRPLDGSHVILSCDVWEHAYYLKHNNRRQDYLMTFWSVVNFSTAEKRFQRAMEECKVGK